MNPINKWLVNPAHRARRTASFESRSKTSLTKEFMMLMAFLEMPVSATGKAGFTGLRAGNSDRTGVDLLEHLVNVAGEGF
jgi:hypothetical protein